MSRISVVASVVAIRLSFAALLAGPVLVPGCTCDDPLARQFPGMRVDPEEVHIQNVAVAQDTEITFTITNDHRIDLTRLTARLDTDGDPNFALTDEPPARIIAGTSGEATVTVRPRTVSKIETTLILESKDDARPTNRYEIPIVIEATDQGLPDICVTPEEIVFTGVGRLSVGREALQVKNCGTRDLLIDCVYIAVDGMDEAAALAEGCPTRDPEDQPMHVATRLRDGYPVQPGDTGGATLDTSFAPVDTLPHTAELVILSNDPDEPEVRVPMSGQGAECPTAVITFLDPEESYEPFDLIRLDSGDSLPVPGGPGLAPQREWRVLQRPVGSTAVLSSDTDTFTELPVDLAGDYEVSLNVFDNDGIRSCEPAIVTIPVIPTEDLVVQLVWDHPTADLDLHTVRDGGTVFTHAGDCYFSNREPPATCVGACGAWSANPDENPVLDHDDPDGYGPENMHIVHPAPNSRWNLRVHYWNSHLGDNVQDAGTTATLRVFAYGQQITELQHTFEEDQFLWDAVEIVWPDDDTTPPDLNQNDTVTQFDRPF